jgi:hypothetical protein
MAATTVTRELFQRETVPLAKVQDEQRLRIAAGAIRSTVDQQSDPVNFILVSEWNLIGQNDAAALSAPAAGQPSAGFASNAILAEFHGNGASAATAAQDHLAPGPGASLKMATTDLKRVSALKQRFNVAAGLIGLPPALLAGIASRESRCGAVLDAHGFGDAGHAFGIMQVDARFHTPAGVPDPRSQAHINQAAGVLKQNLAQMIAKFATAEPARQLQAAVAAYNCGAGRVGSPATADARTTGHDYSNDVWERARFYASGW